MSDLAIVKQEGKEMSEQLKEKGGEAFKTGKIIPEGTEDNAWPANIQQDTSSLGESEIFETAIDLTFNLPSGFWSACSTSRELTWRMF